MTSYLTYWKPQNLDWDEPGSQILNHTAGNQLKKVARCDQLYIFTYRDGVFYLLGRIVANSVVTKAQAAKRLEWRSDELWPADYHVLASKPFMQAVAIPFTKTLQQLQLASDRAIGLLTGSDSVQQFRMMRRITHTSASALDALLADIHTGPDYLPDLDIHVEQPSSLEGKRILRMHLARERDPKLVAFKKQAAASLACEACGLLFGDRYGARAADYCEVHHLLPFAQLDAPRKTRLKDLAILCANCHRVAHLRTPPYTIDQIRRMLRDA
jgi:predicted HNH restriction endonuclease